MRKSYFKIFLLFFILVAFVLSAGPVWAQGLVKCGGDSKPCTWNDLFILANDFIQFLITTVAIPLVTIVLVVSGVRLVMAQDSGAYTEAKKNLKLALLGLVIMLSSWLIVKVVIDGLTMGKDTYNLRGEFKK